MKKILAPAIAYAALCIGVTLFARAFVQCLDIPTVYEDTASSAPVGCLTLAMDRPAPIEDPRCQAVLEGHYDLVPVAPGWRP